MQGGAGAAQAKGMDQRDRDNQEKQRIGLLSKDQHDAEQAGAQQDRAFRRTLERRRAVLAQRVRDQHHRRHQQDHAHTVGEEPAQRTLPYAHGLALCLRSRVEIHARRHGERRDGCRG